MKYISTRGRSPVCNFEQVLLTGLAPDGGLYIPESLPTFSVKEISSWSGLPYHELAFKIIKPFVDGEIPDDVLQSILHDSYKDFSHPAIAPLRMLGVNEWVLELLNYKLGDQMVDLFPGTNGMTLAVSKYETKLQGA